MNGWIVEARRDFNNCMYIHTCHSFLHTKTMTQATHDRFDWGLVRSFLAALEHGSLMGAARATRSSQPTLGRHIAELESQLGVVLFERTGRGLVPTASALQVADSARQMERSALDLARTLRGTQQALLGSVRITASVPVAVALLPPILARMRLALPEIQIELVSSNQVSNLLRREADIAVRMVRPAQHSLIARKMGQVAMGAYAHRSYLARRGTPRKPQDLLAHELIGSDADTNILRGFEAMGFPAKREQFSLRTDDFIVQWQAVRAGLGVGFLASYMQSVDADVLPVLPDQLKIAPLPMWLAVHREIRTSRRIRAVYDFLAAELPQVL